MSLDLYLQVLGLGSGMGGGGPGTYSLTGGSISSDEDDGNTVNSELLYDSDGGTRNRKETFVLAPFYVDRTPWSTLHPAETDGASWSIWLEHTSGSDFWDGGDALDTWHLLSTDRVFEFAYLNGGPATDTGTYTARLSNDGGMTDHDTAVWTINMEVQQPF